MSSTDRVMQALFCVEQRVDSWTPLQSYLDDCEFRLVMEEERLCSLNRSICFLNFEVATSRSDIDERWVPEDEAMDVLVACLRRSHAEAPRADAWRSAGKLKLVHTIYDREIGPVVSSCFSFF